MSSDLVLKGQGVRLADVFVLGPFMVWFGWKARDVPDIARAAMIISGVGTSIYNGVNFVRHLRR